MTGTTLANISEERTRYSGTPSIHEGNGLGSRSQTSVIGSRTSERLLRCRSLGRHRDTYTGGESDHR